MVRKTLDQQLNIQKEVKKQKLNELKQMDK